ncbi:MAG: hypothetical protein RLZZ602_1258, partial [Pseudomonadota bacterium]
MAPELYSRLQTDFAYHTVDGAVDELMGDDLGISPTWHYMMESLAALGGSELFERQRKATSLLRDVGATFRAH